MDTSSTVNSDRSSLGVYVNVSTVSPSSLLFETTEIVPASPSASLLSAVYSKAPAKSSFTVTFTVASLSGFFEGSFTSISIFVTDVGTSFPASYVMVIPPRPSPIVPVNLA